jgi:cupin fold WbuC family metalloprotein
MKAITPEILDELSAKAEAAQRRRSNLNLHESYEDRVNRFLNAGNPGSYVRPHRHREGRWELMSLLRGRLDIVTFSAEGVVIGRIVLAPGKCVVAELPGGSWHSILFREPGTIVLEVKPGPYDATIDKEFADWAPKEGEPAAANCVAWMEAAKPGAAFTDHVRADPLAAG